MDRNHHRRTNSYRQFTTTATKSLSRHPSFKEPLPEASTTNLRTFFLSDEAEEENGSGGGEGAAVDDNNGESAATPETIWNNLTKRLLDGAEERLYEFDRAIRYWVRKRTPESAKVLWNLWEICTKIHTNPEIQAPLFLLLLDHWRILIITRVAVPFTVEKMWLRVKDCDWMNIKAYSILLSALSHEVLTNNLVDNVLLAEEILQQFLDQSNKSAVCQDHLESKESQESAVVLWNSLLTVVAKSGGEYSGDRAEKVLRRMQRHGVVPDEISYACVLEAWAYAAKKDFNAPNNADRLLAEMVQNCGPRVHSTKDDERSREAAAAVCYLQTLRAWCNSALDEGADHAAKILESMVESYLSNQPLPGFYHGVKPGRHCFSAVMSGYAQRGKPEKVQSLLELLQNLYDRSDSDKLFQPTQPTFNSVFEAYARQASPESALKAQNLLEKLYAMASKSNDKNAYWPDTTTVNTCIHAWAESGAPDAVERAEALLLTASEWENVEIDEVSYTTVMKAWSRSLRPEAAERCESILQQMWLLYDARSESLLEVGRATKKKTAKPNAITYATAIYAWSQSNDPDAPLRAEAIYQDMMERSKKGDLSLEPIPSIYVQLITTWARSSRKEADLRAQLYFDQMRGKFMAGYDKLRPDGKLYNALITSKKIRHDGEGAEMVLRQMYDDYLNFGNKLARPNRRVFHNVMSAWADSRRPDAPQRIEKLLFQMKNEYEKKRWDCKPNEVSFTILFNSLSKVGTKAAAERCEAVLQFMHQMGAKDEEMKPSNFTYGTIMDAWGRIAKSDPEGPIRAQALFDDMLRRYDAGDQKLKPNTYNYNALLTAWARSTHPEAGKRSLAILNEMEERHKLDSKNDAPNEFVFSAVINAFANTGDIVNAKAVFHRMTNSDSVKPHVTGFNALMKAYDRARLKETPEIVMQLLNDMIYVYSVAPDIVSYSTCLACFQHSGHPSAYEKSKALVETLIAFVEEGHVHLTPNVTMFGSLLSTLRESNKEKSTKAAEVEYVIGLMNQFKVQPNKEVAKELLAIRDEINAH
jgi:pentatricopeptide repeat protein